MMYCIPDIDGVYKDFLKRERERGVDAEVVIYCYKISILIGHDGQVKVSICNIFRISSRTHEYFGTSEDNKLMRCILGFNTLSTEGFRFLPIVMCKEPRNP